jgi:ATP-dependent Clp protease adaptor protein ClpS
MSEKNRTELDEAAVAENSDRVKRPPRYRVLLHNDDFTTMEFVVYVLMTVFHMGDADAVRVMLQVHTEGIGVAGIYPFEIAESKARKVVEMARAEQFPLMCSIQEE